MEKVRLLYFRSKSDNGNYESVYFTQDFDSPADDFCRPDCFCFLDQEIEMDTTQWPMEYEMVKSR